MATTAQRALLTALSMIVLASLAAGRVISPESVWAGEPALELPHKAAVPELLTGVFHGGISVKNATSGKSDYLFLDYYAVDETGKFWGQYRGIMKPTMTSSGYYQSVTPIVEGTNYTVMVVHDLPEKDHECWVITVKNSTKTNTTSQEGIGSFGNECPENKTMANFTWWLKAPKAAPTPAPVKEYLYYP